MNGWKYLRTFTALFLALAVLSATRADARQTIALPSTVSHGIRLSLSMPRLTYPRDALVDVKVTLRNVSHQTIVVPVQCAADNPAVEVVRQDGAVVYPPALPGVPAAASSCQLVSPPVPLPPGRTITGKRYVVLRSNALRAVANFEVLPEGTSQSNPVVLHVATPLLRVRLVHRPAPHIALTGAPALHAHVTAANGNTQGRLLYMDWYRCQSAQGTVLGGHVSAWAPAPESPVLVPGCGQPVAWHVVAGWRGQPVAYLNYVQADASVLSSEIDGVTLTANVPRRTYARNSLIKVTVRIKNGTRHAIRLPGFPEDCGSSNPVIMASTDSGIQLYPPGISLLVPPPCFAPDGPTLPGGQAVTATLYTVARGPNVQAVLQFARRSDSPGLTTLSTSVRKLHFTWKPEATAAVHVSSSGVYAVFHKPRGAHGPMLYEADDTCSPHDVQVNHTALWWSQTAQAKLTPSCPGPMRWVVVAGWPNYPVAQIDYTCGLQCSYLDPAWRSGHWVLPSYMYRLRWLAG